MIVAMSQVQLLGRSDDLPALVEELQSFGAVEVSVGSDGEAREAADLRAELQLVETLLAGEVPGDGGAADVLARPTRPVPLDRGAVGRLEARVRRLQDEAERLRAEHEQLHHQLEVLTELEGLVPELAALSDAELATLRLAVVALLLDDPSGQVVAVLREQLTGRLGQRFLLVSAPRGRVRGCLLVVPRDQLAWVEATLGRDQITRVSVPDDYAGLSLHRTVAQMADRLAVVDEAAGRARDRVAQVQREIRPELLSLRREYLAVLERDRAVAAAERSTRTFLLQAWVPRGRLEDLRAALADRAGPPVVVLETGAQALREEDRPVLLANRAAFEPYQRLVGFLSWPSARGIDPSGLMALALPFLFGVMVGDIAYGLLLMAIGWWLRRRRATVPGSLADDAGRILVVGGAWSTVWGVLFGELFGSLGNQWGMPALWFYRGGPDALEPLLLFAVALGVLHVLVGLVLGLWVALRRHDRHLAQERGGTLVVLLAVLVLIAGLAGWLPGYAVWAAAAVAVLGMLVAAASHGPLGLLLGPLELLGAFGNVLSYLRVAAVGLASVYLANVTNVLAAQAPLVLGILIAVFFHTLNLGLAAFSPMVQALRLHYVEFFSKFHDGGGRPFRPLGQHGSPTVAVPPPSPGPRPVRTPVASPVVRPPTKGD